MPRVWHQLRTRQRGHVPLVYLLADNKVPEGKSIVMGA